MSHLTFEEHNLPRAIDVSSFGTDYQAMTVKWKGLDFLRVVYTEETTELKQALKPTRTTGDDDDDEPDHFDDDDDNHQPLVPLEVAPKPVRVYHVQCLMPSFAYYWGKTSSLEEAKTLALKAEQALVKFAYMIQTRRST